MIHATASVHPDATVGRNVSVGAYAYIGPAVEVGDGCRVGHHAVLEGPLRIGADNDIGPHAVLGMGPQDLGYQGEPTELRIGDRNVIREFVTIHRATVKADRVTEVGNDNMLMAYCHVGHDCKVGNHIVMANGATLAGHVVVHDHVNIAGLCAIHQFARIGAYAMLGGGTMAPMDITPYAMVSGNHARLFGLNRRGLQRHGFDKEAVTRIRKAYRILFQSGLRLETALKTIEADPELSDDSIRYLLTFIRGSKRGITR
jgi:UDP-N-acetylglucosamine acyltransferase